MLEQMRVIVTERRLETGLATVRCHISTRSVYVHVYVVNVGEKVNSCCFSLRLLGPQLRSLELKLSIKVIGTEL